MTQTIASVEEHVQFFKNRRKANQRKKAHNRENSPKMLKEAGVQFRSCNDGLHLIVQGPKEAIDFWPGTGKWRERGTNITRYGVRGLIKYIQTGYRGE